MKNHLMTGTTVAVAFADAPALAAAAPALAAEPARRMAMLVHDVAAKDLPTFGEVEVQPMK